MRHYAVIRLEVSGSIPFRVLGNAQVTFLSVFNRPGVHTASDGKEYQGISLRFKLRPKRGTDESAVLVVSNVMGTPNPPPPKSS